MPSPAKKQFPGIFVIVAISFIIYLSIVTWVIMAHYKRPPKTVDGKKISATSSVVGSIRDISVA